MTYFIITKKQKLDGPSNEVEIVSIRNANPVHDSKLHLEIAVDQACRRSAGNNSSPDYERISLYGIGQVIWAKNL